MSFQKLLAESLHGFAAKSLALGSRLAFFIWVIPILLEGQLAIYVYVTSTALILAMIAVMGLNEELPRVIAGDIRVARQYSGAILFLESICIVLGVALVSYPSVFLAIIAFAFVCGTGNLLAGVTRSLSPALYETQANVPWIFFILFSISLGLQTGLVLVATMIFCMIGVQLYCAWSSGIFHTSSRTARSAPKRVHVNRVIGGISRLLSNVIFFATIRSPLLISVWIGRSVDLDQIAMAIAIGEIVAQFGLIPVNRSYSRWCQKTPSVRVDFGRVIGESISVAAVLSVLSVGGLWMLSHLDWLPPQISDLTIIAQALIYYAIVPAFVMIRYFSWSRDQLSLFLIFLPFLQFALCFPIIFYVDSSLWFSFLTILLIGTVAIMALRTLKAPVSIDGYK